jgi:hypothetical protein
MPYGVAELVIRVDHSHPLRVTLDSPSVPSSVVASGKVSFISPTQVVVSHVVPAGDATRKDALSKLLAEFF